MEIEIIAMQRIAEPKPNKSGDRIVATFDCHVGPFTLRNCVLAEIYNRGGTEYKGLRAWGPHIMSRTGARGVSFRDKSVQREIRDHAVEVFRALGGEVKPEPVDHGPVVPGVMVV